VARPAQIQSCSQYGVPVSVGAKNFFVLPILAEQHTHFLALFATAATKQLGWFASRAWVPYRPFTKARELAHSLLLYCKTIKISEQSRCNRNSSFCSVFFYFRSWPLLRFFCGWYSENGGVRYDLWKCIARTTGIARAALRLKGQLQRP
jgi:hypothetical protein